MNKGYHYTSFDRWVKIEKKGLIPYAINKIELWPYLDGYPAKGVWVWKHRMKGESHVGSILWQVATKAATKIVLLEVNYNPEDILCGSDGVILTLYHKGSIENWHYHTKKESESSVIVTKPIPPENIKLLKVYDLVELLKAPTEGHRK